MNVGIAYNEFGNAHGIERVSSELARALARMGHDISFYCARVEPGSRSDGVHIHKVPTVHVPHSAELLSFAISARRKVSTGNHHLTHSHGSVVGCDIVTAHSCHKAGLLEASRFLRKSASRGINLGLCDRVRLMIEHRIFGLRNYRKVIAVSTSVQRELIQFYALPPEDISVIPNGVDLNDFSPVKGRRWREEIRSNLTISSSDFVLLFVGNEFARKGLDTVLRSLTFLPHGAAHLIICGDDDDRDYRRLAASLGVDRHVHFAGHQNDIAKYYAATDALVLPTYHEAFGLVTLEAMASGLPAVVSRSSGAGEDVISDGRDGLLLSDPGSEEELAAKITCLLANPQFRKELGLKAREKARSFGWEVCVRKVYDLYQEISDQPIKPLRGRT